jgi:hypothetical protein
LFFAEALSNTSLENSSNMKQDGEGTLNSKVRLDRDRVRV